MFQKIKNIYHLFIAIGASIFFGFPAKKIKVIGVTGTDGKTTTVYLIYHLLKTAGFKVSMVSSIGAVINDKEYDTGFHVTTPSSFDLQKLLRKALDANSEYFVLEVTSHALDQNRVWGIPFTIGAITNITREHFDYHKTYENYVKTKKRLLRMSKIQVVNKDDKSYSLLGNDRNRKTYGLLSGDVNLKNFTFKNDSLIGEFNKYNVLCAVAVCRALGLVDNRIKKGIESFKLPLGRLDLVFSNNFNVIIDFAHTPNAFEEVLRLLRSQTTGRIIHVFGSAGERDKSKRPLLGKISSEFSDVIILTAEDSRSENTESIIGDISKGIKTSNVQIFKVPKRIMAIEKAIGIARDGDLVLITGKAHERSMNLGYGEKPWDEYEAVKKALEKKGLSHE